jgi:hypothetical protein
MQLMLNITGEFQFDLIAHLVKHPTACTSTGIVCLTLLPNYKLIKHDMDVNKHERLSTFTLRHKLG